MRDFFVGLLIYGLIYVVGLPVVAYLGLRKGIKRFIAACQKMGREERIFK